jgi:transposase
MGLERYELSDAQWERIAPLLPGKTGDPGRTGADNRPFVNGVLWILTSGAHWRDLPDRYGTRRTAHHRFSRWSRAGVWERVFADLIKARDNQYLVLDSTLVRAHQQATMGRSSGQKKGGSIRLWGIPEVD